jgi:hypothetical protein
MEINQKENLKVPSSKARDRKSELSIEDQLEMFADILIDHLFDKEVDTQIADTKSTDKGY